ncbi:MAG: 2-oxoglutarate dehydrogenase E1 component, partial [Calditrichia bacterium]
LLKAGSVEKGLAEEMEKEFRQMLQFRLSEAKEKKKPVDVSTMKGDWQGFRKPKDSDFRKSPVTAVQKEVLQQVGERLFTVPEELNVFAKIRRLYDERKERFLEGKKLDWAIGEFLAYGTLLSEGVPVRIAGQDTARGTFSHRHAVLLIEDTEEKFIPFDHISEKQGKFQIINSLLSEYGAMGFEYGYAFAHPKGLTVWEAQFGDFANGAQIIIDQYLSSSEAKWKRSNGLVLYLPHGYEGQGPEHSSARIERFLTLCAKNNMQVVNCTTPANLFHVLRRQVHYPFRIPLIIFTPKSLLRHPLCVSSVDDFTKGGFKEVIDDTYVRAADVRKLIFCSGKIFYDLYERQQAEKRKDIAIARVEQLYPLPIVQLQKVLKKYNKVEEYNWVQEEPENMGPWPYIRRKFKLVRTRLISRAEDATPATGYHKIHVKEQQEIIDLAFGAQKEIKQKVVTQNF